MMMAMIRAEFRWFWMGLPSPHPHPHPTIGVWAPLHERPCLQHLEPHHPPPELSPYSVTVPVGGACERPMHTPHLPHRLPNAAEAPAQSARLPTFFRSSRWSTRSQYSLISCSDRAEMAPLLRLFRSPVHQWLHLESSWVLCHYVECIWLWHVNTLRLENSRCRNVLPIGSSTRCSFGLIVVLRYR